MTSLLSKIKLYDRFLLPDDRGFFVKILTGNEDHLKKAVGEIYVTQANPGSYRANHYHKKTNEWFTIIHGKATVVIEDIHTKERQSFILDAKQPKTLFCPPNIAHVFINQKNSETDFVLVAYADLKYDPNDTVMYDLTN